MKRLLFSWIGNKDLEAAHRNLEAGLGPIGQAVTVRQFDEIILLSDFEIREIDGFCAWLKAHTDAIVTVSRKRLPNGPMDFGAIYKSAQESVAEVQQRLGASGYQFVYHLSPGTSAMAAVWIILAKTRYPAELIQSSKEAGVETASVPFDIAAEFIPDLLHRPDRQLAALAMGSAPEAPEFEDIVHRSAEMRRVIERARRVALHSVPVLIEGESGTGKELFARAIHRASHRREKPFITVNCGAIPIELVESELFGHKKGAFTGAVADRRGHIRAADGGTLFLDELGELPLAAQVKLLRVLQENEVLPVGSSEPIKVDVRVISATHRNLIEEISRGHFREDLFYRLAVAVIKLPPLRERQGDLSLLIDRLLEHVNQKNEVELGYKRKKISPAAKNLMLQHPWPGNVRELLNTLQRVAVWSTGETIGADDMREALFPASRTSNSILHRPLGKGFDIEAIIAEVARHYLKRALSEAGGNKTEAARLVNLPSYQTLTNWLKKYEVAE